MRDFPNRLDTNHAQNGSVSTGNHQTQERSSHAKQNCGEAFRLKRTEAMKKKSKTEMSKYRFSASQSQSKSLLKRTLQSHPQGNHGISGQWMFALISVRYNCSICLMAIPAPSPCPYPPIPKSQPAPSPLPFPSIPTSPSFSSSRHTSSSDPPFGFLWTDFGLTDHTRLISKTPPRSDGPVADGRIHPPRLRNRV